MMFRKAKSLLLRLLPPGIRGRLRNWRLRRLVKRYKPRTVRHTYGGHELLVMLPDPLAAGWYDHDWPVLAEVRFLRQHRLRPGATVFDLGAHQGVVALMLANEVTSTGRVVAVEANPHNALAAQTNARLNRADHVIVLHAAISDKPGTVTFNEGLNGQVDDGSAAWGRREVTALTVDQLTNEYGPPSVLFIDVEGFECQALRGSSETLGRHRPDCFVEIHLGCGLEKFGSLDELLEFFTPDHYSLFHLTADVGDAAVTPATANELRARRERFFLLAIARD